MDELHDIPEWAKKYEYISSQKGITRCFYQYMDRNGEIKEIKCTGWLWVFNLRIFFLKLFKVIPKI